MQITKIQKPVHTKQRTIIPNNSSPPTALHNNTTKHNFKSTQIASSMMKYCMQASEMTLKGDMLKLRKKLFEIITFV